MAKALFIWFVFNAIVYLVLGMAFVFQFESVAENLGIVTENGSAVIELIAVYGGLELGFGILFIVALSIEKYRLFAVRVLAFTYASFAGGRLIGMLKYEAAENMTYYLLLFEVLGFVISTFLLLKVDFGKSLSPGYRPVRSNEPPQASKILGGI